MWVKIIHLLVKKRLALCCISNTHKRETTTHFAGWIPICMHARVDATHHFASNHTDFIYDDDLCLVQVGLQFLDTLVFGKFLEKLTRLPASGVIATHDLSLCVVADSSPQVHNQFFDVTIGTEDLDFDYVLRDGVCANMNATFLMDKMGITR